MSLEVNIAKRENILEARLENACQVCFYPPSFIPKIMSHK